MKTPLLHPRALAGLASLALAFLFFCAPAYTLGKGQGQGQGGKDGGDDDVGTLPATAEQDPPSLVLIGSLHELQDVVIDVHGTGKLSLRPIAPGSTRLMLEFDGSFDLTLDVEALATTQVETYFSSGTTFAGGAVVYFAGGTWSGVHTLEPNTAQKVPLSSGDVGLLRAYSRDGHLFTLSSVPAGDSVLRVSQTLLR